MIKIKQVEDRWKLRSNLCPEIDDLKEKRYVKDHDFKVFFTGYESRVIKTIAETSIC